MKRVTLLMNDTVFYLLFVLITVLLYWPSYRASQAFSGRRFSPLKLFAVGLYNLLCGAIHVFFVNYSTLPFIGHADNDVMGWLSLVMVFVYTFTLPTEWERKRSRTRNPPADSWSTSVVYF
ncbi:hypothetical protein [Pseudomonas lundensis]|uniref:hypothetical protein n=1 Tax=Pseudomonas lundensis TaxID=86185 RepID=UPI001472D1D2|nr:hypothetical protein [Pseudomonas lundensis]NNA03154.1 hypothetical protein [Pseudomonas lundensis]